MFQFGVLCVRAVIRIQRLRYTPEPVSLAVTRVDPYKVKALRKVSILWLLFLYIYQNNGIFGTLLVIDNRAVLV